MDNGWIKINRKILDWEWYTDIPVRLTFIHLLITANWEDKKWKGILIKRGQVLTGGIKTPKEIGISRSKFRRAMEVLKTTTEITTKTTNKNTLVTIVNYEKYQDLEKKQPSKRPQNNHQTTTTKEYKNIKKRKEEFKNSLRPFLNIYTKEMLKDFFGYWTEHGEKDKKMRFEKEKSYSLSRRLKTWKIRDVEFKNKNRL